MPRFEQLPGDATVPHRYVKIQVRLPILSLSVSFTFSLFLFLFSNVQLFKSRWQVADVHYTNLSTHTIAGAFQIKSDLSSFFLFFVLPMDSKTVAARGSQRVLCDPRLNVMMKQLNRTDSQTVKVLISAQRANAFMLWGRLSPIHHRLLLLHKNRDSSRWWQWLRGSFPLN